MQLVAYGAQDVFLTGTPEITFWKVSYRRHTNFAMEAISQTFDGKVDYGRKTSVTISRNGDLVHKVYVEVNLALKDASLSNSVELGNAFAFIKTVELEIGGQLIDRHYGDWMNIWCELTHSVSKGEQLEKLVDLTNKRVYIPLQFSFCRNPGLAIPLIAGPGAITITMLIAEKSEPELISRVISFLPVMLSVILAGVCMWLSSKLVEIISLSLLSVIQRVFGLLLGALAIEYVISGIKIHLVYLE